MMTKILECVGGPFDGGRKRVDAPLNTYWNGRTHNAHHYREALCLFTGRRWLQYDGVERIYVKRPPEK